MALVERKIQVLFFLNDERCTKKFSKPFREETGTDEDVGPQYYVNLKCMSPGHLGEQGFRRTLILDVTHSFHKHIPVKNSCVVPYNPIFFYCSHVISTWIYAISWSERPNICSIIFVKVTAVYQSF